MEYDVIIGLEIHAELKTKSKMFCACDNNPEGKKPNEATCPICLGHPGTLPVPNKQAIEWTILTGLALHCRVNELSKFDRKNYFYPDLPKGYQISQYDLPLVHDGYLLVDGERVAITRIHLEEDTGKNTHPAGKPYSLIDMNRAGTPLMEMVTEPVLKSAEQAKKFCQNYQQVLRYLGISDANMEKGEMRCEANISVQEKGKWRYEGNCEIKAVGDYKLNPKVEVKNINSFRAIEKAIEYEIKRQTQAIQANERLIQETRGWDENKSETVSQRSKESSADYRYFPEPDIPPLRISPEDIKRIGAALIEMPPEKKERFQKEYGFDAQSTETICANRQLASFSENVISELEAWINSSGENWDQNRQKLIKMTSSWICSELLKYLGNSNDNLHDLSHLSAENFAELITLLFEEKINSSAGQTILARMIEKGGDPSQLMAELGLEQVHDDEALKQSIEAVLAKNPSQVAEYKAGKENVIQFLVGQTMAHTKGKANPKKVIELMKELLK
jgi:aspartyl-tRNA(Asn)/glutamyl-tRNA(Gln) amidotransferase subunit B